MLKILLSLLIALNFFAALQSSAEDDPHVKAGDAGDKRVRELLANKVSFEFVDTPFEDVINFLKTITKVNFVVDQATRDAAPAITLKVADVSMEKALNYIAHLTRANWTVRDEAVFVEIPKDVIQEIHKQEKQEEPNKPQPKTPFKLRAKFANGNEIEFTTEDDDKQALANQLLERSMDPAADGLLVYRTDAFPEKLKPGSLTALLEAQAKVNVTGNSAFKLLIVKGDPAELRKVQAVMGALGCSTLDRPDANDEEEHPNAGAPQALPEIKAEKPVLPGKNENF